ncbi:TlpA disulfide reductase family protein [Pedobacter sp.]|jgi:peroxiredoxin|uniref:TlpA disulfide reductase family protein n=1 Tax=Pedobacter sp. TaxID=1411316 RepID=UPI002B67CD9F|nr:TlpA disulfide reductase family protein [Pedobacter sp.]HWW38878.1 TlpA disulfide reductase family protein [Pedobacter sp.]
MRKMACLFVLLLFLVFNGNAQGIFKIHGSFTLLKKEMKVVLAYNLNHKEVRDSTVTRNGLFDFSGTVPSALPVKATLGFLALEDHPNTSYVEQLLKIDEQDFFIEKGTVLVKGSSKMNTAVITGGKTQQELLSLQGLKREERDKMLNLQDEMIPLLIQSQGFAIDSNKKVQAISAEMQPLVRKMREKEELFIKTHPDSYVTLDLVAQRSRMMRTGSFTKMLSGLSPRLRNSKSGKEMLRRLSVEKQTAIGVKAMDFSEPDADGNIISLDAFKGKYVLLNFWASWSEASRGENLDLLTLYLQFKNKGFEILSVSLDADREKWLNAVGEDHLIWPQLSDLRGWNNKAAQVYAITSVPKNFLIGPDGRIVGKDLFGEALLEKLEEVLR